MSDPLQSARKRLRAWLNRRRLEKERDFYEDAFRYRGLKIPGEAEIRAAMRERFPQMKPVPPRDIAHPGDLA